MYDALSAGKIDTPGIEDRVVEYPLDGGERVYAVDISTWLKCDVETSSKRDYYHHHSRQTPRHNLEALAIF